MKAFFSYDAHVRIRAGEYAGYAGTIRRAVPRYLKGERDTVYEVRLDGTFASETARRVLVYGEDLQAFDAPY